MDVDEGEPYQDDELIEERQDDIKVAYLSHSL